jgi:hypothetical protein
MSEGAESHPETGEACSDKKLESPQFRTNVHHLCKTIRSSIVDKVEGLHRGSMMDSVSSIVGSSSVVVLNAGVQVCQVDHLQERQVSEKAGNDSRHDLLLRRLALRVEVEFPQVATTHRCWL